MFEMLKEFYDKKLYSIEDVKLAVDVKLITKEEYKEIIGEELK